MNIGELFVIGFRGKEIPSWLLQFEERYGLGGVILFDYNCQTKTYDNNVESPAQVTDLCSKISSLKSRPLLFVDQEGGKVRRLKENRGFAPLPSALRANSMPEQERLAVLRKSFHELKALGIDYNLAPVIDLNYNPANPDIGAVERSFSVIPAEVETNFRLYNQAAKEANIGLSLKHYPGLGGAAVNSHLELTDLSDTVSHTQLELFWNLGRQIHGDSVLVSHGIVRQWDPELPTTMSAKALSTLREKLPETLLISDDLQMQGLRKKLSLAEACEQGLNAGLDMLCIGNNLMPDDDAVLDIAKDLTHKLSQKKVEPSIRRVQQRKTQFKT